MIVQVYNVRALGTATEKSVFFLFRATAKYINPLRLQMGLKNRVAFTCCNVRAAQRVACNRFRGRGPSTYTRGRPRVAHRRVFAGI